MKHVYTPGVALRWRPTLTVFALLLSFGALAQTAITGTVSDGDGLPLIGVSVYPENNTAAGTVTDLDGNFTLNVTQEDENLVFSYVGYQRRVLPINNQTRITVRMEENSETLEEVVVVAYGESKREDIIGSVDQVTNREIEDLQVNSFDQALQGQVAGVQVRTGSGRPDGGSEILIRGVSTSGNNAPLVVIDGVPTGNFQNQENNLFSLINPNDIESISVIRDASGKALYGSRAGNGLILITTKRGQVGKPTINLNATSGIQTIPDYEVPNNLNATELAQFLRDRLELRGQDIPENLQDPGQYGEGTDWWDLITRTGSRHNVDLSVRGGTEQTRYSFSGGFTQNSGVIKETDFTRYTLRATLDTKITDWLSGSITLNPSQTESNVAGGIDPGTAQFQAYTPLQVARWADPTAPAYDDNGNLTQLTRGELLPFYQANPLYYLENVQRTETNRRIQAQMSLDATILPGLTFRQLGGYILIYQRGRRFRSGSVAADRTLTPNITNDPQANSSASVGVSESQRLLSESTLTYTKQFAQRHNVDLLAGYIVETQKQTFINTGGDRIINEDFTLFNSGNIATFNPSDPTTTRIFFEGSEAVAEQALISYIGRAQYNFDQKYYLTAAVRRDASSRFGPGLTSAVFPSLALAWRTSKEPWFPKGGVVSDLRFELSVGEVGNNSIGNYQYQGNVGGVEYVFGNVLAPGFTVTGLPNPFLSWETVRQTDVGVELGMLDNRVNVEATYYTSTTEDLLFNAELPDISGVGAIISNIGSIENRGVEVQVRTKPIIRDNLVWTFDFNITRNRNEVEQLGFENTPIFQTQAGNGQQVVRTFAGGPIGNYYGLQLTGLFTEEDLANADTPRYPGAVVGAPKYVDGDGDGRLEIGEDYVDLGNPFPDFNYGFTSFLTYRDFGLRIVANGEQGSLIYDLSREIELNTDGVFNVRREALDFYRPGDTDFSVRTPTVISDEASRRYRTPTSAGVYDGSFFAISNVTLSYKLDRLLESIESIRGLTLSLGVQNLAVFSPFYGNPQTGRASNAFERNINYNTYPSVRTYVLGLNVNL